MNKKYYVYRHFNKEKGVFYIGLGSTKCRSHTKRNRNRYWLNIVNKYGFIVEILKNDLTKDDAIELECFLISQYGRIDLKTGCLVNMTCGGDGINELSEESELKRREKLRNVVISEERKKHLSVLLKNRKVLDSTKQKQSINQIGTGNSFFGKRHTLDRIGQKNSNSKIVMNKENGFFYETVIEASEIYSLNKVHLSKCLNGTRKNKTLLIKV